MPPASPTTPEPIHLRRVIRPGGILRWFDGVWIHEPWVHEAFSLQQADRIGLRVHLLLGIACCFAASLPITFFEWAMGLAAFASLARITQTWRLWWHLLIQPAFLLGLLFLTWRAASLAWSENPGQGVEDLRGMRFMLLMGALWPLMQYRTLLILAWAAGFVLGHVVQLAQIAGERLDLAWLIWEHQAPGRYAGWWGPVAGGTALCAVLGLHLWALLHGTGRWRTLAALLAALTLLGILATGTRGAWIASILLLGLWLASAAWLLARGRLQRRPPGRRSLTLVAAAGVLVAAGAWLAIGDAVTSRARTAMREIRLATSEANYDSDTGARILMWEEAWRAFLDHPLHGVGLGAYETWAEADAARLDPPPPPQRILSHAHGTVPHLAATGGLVSLVLFSLLVVAALRAGLTAPRGPTGYERATALALGGLLLAAIFETLTTSARSSGQFWMLVALSPVIVPRQLWRGVPRGTPAGNDRP